MFKKDSTRAHQQLPSSSPVPHGRCSTVVVSASFYCNARPVWREKTGARSTQHRAWSRANMFVLWLQFPDVANQRAAHVWQCPVHFPDGFVPMWSRGREVLDRDLGIPQSSTSKWLAPSAGQRSPPWHEFLRELVLCGTQRPCAIGGSLGGSGCRGAEFLLFPGSRTAFSDV